MKRLIFIGIMCLLFLALAGCDLGTESSLPTPGSTAPNIPINVTANDLSSSSIRVSWPADSYATGYYVYRSTSSFGSYSRVGTVSTTSFTDTGLLPSTTYHYRVSAYNNYGTSSQSTSTSATTRAAPPNTPTNVTASALSSSSIRVSWSTVSGATGYYVYRWSAANNSWIELTSVSSTSFTDTGLVPDTTYSYIVSAYNSSGASSPSAYVSARTEETNNTLLGR